MSDIGHNNPPTPFDDAIEALDAIAIEARNWLDGAEVSSQEEADAIGRLTALARQSEKTLDALRVEEKRPHDEAGKAVQERFKPYLKKCDLIVDACKKSLTPYLKKLDDEKREAERIAREKADKLREEAEAAIRSAKGSAIEEREAAEALLTQAKKAETQAAKAENDKASAKTGGRSMSLRTSWRAELVDPREAARHYWITRKADFDELLLKFAREDIAKGLRSLPGFDIVEERSAV